MDINKWIKKLDDLLKITLLNNPNHIYLKKLNSGERQGYFLAVEEIIETFEENEPIYVSGNLSDFFKYFESHTFYCSLAQEKVCTQTNFTLATTYCYLYFLSAYNVKEIGNISIKMDKLSYLFSYLLIAGWEEESQQVFSWMMDDILTKDSSKMRFVKTEGIGIWQMSWFIIRILADHYKYELDDSYYPALK